MSNKNQDRNYWIGRWQRGETGWQQSEVEPALVKWFSNRMKKRIFVPLCGKSLDLKWLADQGHEVVGCELSLDACEAFFREHSILPRVTEKGKFQVFQGGSITIYGGDFFDLTADETGKLDAVYDRAALIALPNDLRKRYTEHMLKILSPSISGSIAVKEFEFLQLVLVRTPTDNIGPPYSVTLNEVEQLYGKVFHPQLIAACEDVDAAAPPGSRVQECSVLLTILS
jgi:thiopurine S-methyltransferase